LATRRVASMHDNVRYVKLGHAIPLFRPNRLRRKLMVVSTQTAIPHAPKRCREVVHRRVQVGLGRAHRLVPQELLGVHDVARLAPQVVPAEWFNPNFDLTASADRELSSSSARPPRARAPRSADGSRARDPFVAHLPDEALGVLAPDGTSRRRHLAGGPGLRGEVASTPGDARAHGAPSTGARPRSAVRATTPRCSRRSRVLPAGARYRWCSALT
jgi:hypothetical protein